MTDDKKTDWSKVDSVIKKEQQEESPVLFEKRKLPTIEQKASEALESADGIITNFKAKKIERKAVLKWLHNWWDNQNELAEKQMKTAVELREKEMFVDSEKFYAEIDNKLVQIMEDLDMRNVERRQKMMVNLAVKTTEILSTVVDKDMPESIKSETIEGISKLRKNFFKKILPEEE